MNFELGKTYIVDVTTSGIIPSIEFNKSRWFDKDHDDLDFLTDEEKIVIINEVLDKIRAEVTAISINGQVDEHTMFIRTGEQIKQMVLEIIDKVQGRK